MSAGQRLRARIDARERGRHQVRTTTWWAAGLSVLAAVAFGAVFGAGGASAGTPATAPSNGGGTTAPTRTTQDAPPAQDNGGGLQPPAQAPAFGYGPGYAASGGS